MNTDKQKDGLDKALASAFKPTDCIDWRVGGITDKERISNLQFSLRNEVDAHVKAIKQRDLYKAHADKLAEALRWIKEVVSERKGTAHWLQMVEDKTRNALAAYEESKQ
jgi:hypothetical protein